MVKKTWGATFIAELRFSGFVFTQVWAKKSLLRALIKVESYLQKVMHISTEIKIIMHSL